ncbi:tRNA dihydrouridine(20/20a) synthase DusA [Pararhodobacter zhoushanensis]|uniref:tRNA-dihydrouridine(20/20a) synthase n=1 Tax=Pararhodobacter zhoushanensis TaxID=2479545 RepID=A0ABT3H1H6_9RHOB|nr:tRNA dihydrouridine(20/20a) synthase DusA [Pararhodobacter zhoushanensis]MCW1933639.1 tRNA dihydrouridine(20/20a) synthase DusA [Pararhodobacter zhoushanensis]
MNTTPPDWRLSVAPMLDWTDSSCRQFHRLLSRHALLYTEMVTSAALVRGGARHLLRFDPCEHPVALQLGGSDPAELAQAARMGADEGYREINLNVGCPSDRVQSGCFGAVLMKTPQLVGECLAAMKAACDAEITVKCRIGVDDQDAEQALPAFLEATRDAGITRVIVHARKAWLKGLSPKENREVPPLDYDLVARMLTAFPELTISLNGGVGTLDEAEALLERGFHGVMIGRAAYHRPAEILAAADRRLYGATQPDALAEDIARQVEPIIAAHLERGGRLIGITRHLLGLFAGQPGARHWRRALSELPNGTLSDYRAVVAGLNERRAA